ncbi:hypothetical protein CSHISOI_03457 [Colletotrichum shisoi]|uniref:Uncharacterized protein n=1 Tax=Colletotrichum shisoi TaxID=2078593 RepID=A0A5Q4C074_9PEZI|nr:hypothetical protein CSHISOI_03457 [Colletotrichum shisoi]
MRMCASVGGLNDESSTTRLLTRRGGRPSLGGRGVASSWPAVRRGRVQTTRNASLDDWNAEMLRENKSTRTARLDMAGSGAPLDDMM